MFLCFAIFVVFVCFLALFFAIVYMFFIYMRPPVHYARRRNIYCCVTVQPVTMTTVYVSTCEAPRFSRVLRLFPMFSRISLPNFPFSSMQFRSCDTLTNNSLLCVETRATLARFVLEIHIGLHQIELSSNPYEPIAPSIYMCQRHSRCSPTPPFVKIIELYK